MSESVRHGRLTKRNRTNLLRANAAFESETSSQLSPSLEKTPLTKEEVQAMIQEATRQKGEGASSGHQSKDSSPPPSSGTLTVQEVQTMIEQAMSQKGHGESSESQPARNQNGSSSQKSRTSASSSGDSDSHSSQQSPTTRGLKRLMKKARGQEPGGSATSSGSSSDQHVAEVLTQAQYELSQELQANLKKLKNVIRESQEIAKKIELVLGQGSSGKSQS